MNLLLCAAALFLDCKCQWLKSYATLATRFLMTGLMRKPRSFVPSILVLLSVIASASVRADELWISNGDRLTGELVKKEKGKIKFKTSYAGTLTVDVGQVDRLILDEPLIALTNIDARVVVKNLVSTNSTESIEDPYPLHEIKILNPTPVDLGEKGEFSGRVNLSVKVENNSNQSDEVDGDYTIRYRYAQHRFESNGQIEYDRNELIPTKRDWLISARYSYFYKTHTYASVWTSFKQEKYDGLNLRSSAGPTIGYEFYARPDKLSSMELGLTYIHEDYVEEADNEFVGATWIVDFETALRERLTFYHKHYATMDATDSSKTLWHSWTGFRVPLVRSFIASIEYEVDYDSQPALREQNTNTTLRFKLGKEW